MYYTYGSVRTILTYRVYRYCIAPNFRGTIFSWILYLTFDHENFPHENLVCSWWAWLRAVQRSKRWRIASTGTYVCVPVTFFHSNGSRKLEVSHTCLSYEGCPDGLKASGTRLEFKTAQRHFYSFLFILTSPNATCKNCRWSDNMNCQCRRHGVEVITKNLAITKFLSWKFAFMWFLAISRKFWTMKIWSYAVYMHIYIA